MILYNFDFDMLINTNIYIFNQSSRNHPLTLDPISSQYSFRLSPEFNAIAPIILTLLYRSEGNSTSDSKYEYLFFL